MDKLTVIMIFLASFLCLFLARTHSAVDLSSTVLSNKVERILEVEDAIQEITNAGEESFRQLDDTPKRDWEGIDASLCGNVPNGPVNGKEPDGEYTIYPKQNAKYGSFDFRPSVEAKHFFNVSATIRIDEFEANPNGGGSRGGKGGLYVAYTLGHHEGPGGYFGIQISHKGGQFLFSLWDKGKWTWPMSERCKRNCNDCGKNNRPEWWTPGSTTGTQCKRKSKPKIGDRYEVRLEMIEQKVTVNTAEYLETTAAGVAKNALGTITGDMDITGSVWKATAKNLDDRTEEEFEFGKMLIQGEGKGMVRLGTFDEMLGCVGCNNIQHKDTRYGPTITDRNDDGTTSERELMGVAGRSKASERTENVCSKVRLSGSAKDKSSSYEAGPFTETNVFDGESKTLWCKEEEDKCFLKRQKKKKKAEKKEKRAERKENRMEKKEGEERKLLNSIVEEIMTTNDKKLKTSN